MFLFLEYNKKLLISTTKHFIYIKISTNDWIAISLKVILTQV